MFGWFIAASVVGLTGLTIWRFVKRTEIREKVVYVPPRTLPMPTSFVVPAPQPVEREAPDWEYELIKMYLINEAEELAGQLEYVKQPKEEQLVDDEQSEPQS